MLPIQRSAIFSFGLVSLLLFHSSFSAASRVVVSEVSDELPSQELRLTGDLAAVQSVSVANEITGQVEHVFTEVGDKVNAGDGLIAVRSKTTQLALDEAKALLKSDESSAVLAEQQRERLKRLLETKAVPVETYEQAVTSHEKALADVDARKAAIRALEDALSRHEVVAPFNGVVGRRWVEVGAWLNAGDPVVDLVNDQHLRVKLAIPQQYYQQIASAYASHHESPLLTAYLEGEDQTVEIDRIIPLANEQRNFGLWVNINNDLGQRLPGMSLTVIVRWHSAEQGLSIPEDALIRKADGSILVWKVTSSEEGDTVMPVPVSALYTVDGVTVVSSPALAVGDQLVVRGNETLKPGQTVELVELN